MTGGAVAVYAAPDSPVVVSSLIPPSYRVTQDQILTLSEKIRHLRHQITGAAPTALEDAIAELRDEHKRLDGVGKAMSSALFELEADHEFTENTCLLLTALDDQLEAMRREMVKARETAETLKARLTSEAKKAEGCKHELAQALVTTSRMGYDEAKAYVLAPVRTALKLLEDVPESDAPREILTALTADSWRE